MEVLGNPPIPLPSDAVAYIRQVFAKLNDHCAKTLSLVPNIHEPTLDQILISRLAERPSRRLRASSSVVEFATYFLGGARQYLNRWEIADIGLVINIKKHGQLILTKVALLQSKRLYALEDQYDEAQETEQFYQGFGGVYMAARSPVTKQHFNFTPDSQYDALDLKHEQVTRIDAYPGEHGIPVLYLFYNPLRISWTADVPSFGRSAITGVRNEVGTRIVTAEGVHALKERGIRKPRYRDVAAIAGDTTNAPFSAGWRLEDFVVDLLLACHIGYATTGPDETLYNVFNARNRPIASAFAVNISIGED
jgi:hypothetical protein